MGIKLIEVALPLDKINVAAAREKSIRHGHPSTLHLWWARRPLAAVRAVLFASIVDDPSSPDYTWTDGSTRARTSDEIIEERDRLHAIIERLVVWAPAEGTDPVGEARTEILRATKGNPPPVMDPFAGGGSIPLEAQRLGLEAHASDLNPVAVLITKAMIEIPPKFAGRAPVNTDDPKRLMTKQWKGAEGLASDVRFYGQWMRDEAERRIGHLYPKVRLPPEQGGGGATVIAWLWARTVTCPNPACGATMPLVSSFWLSKKGQAKSDGQPASKHGISAWVVPHPDPVNKRVDFTVQTGAGEPQEPPKLGRGGTFKCLCCGQSATERHVKDEGRAGRMGAQLMCVVAEGGRGRVYVAPDQVQSDRAVPTEAYWNPSEKMPENPRWFSPPAYGLTTFGDLFTPRQLVALTTFSDLVEEARERVRADAITSGLPDDHIGLANGGLGASAYADAIAIYLAFAVDRLADLGSSIATWINTLSAIRNTFGRQAIAMSWDFAEANPFSASSGCFGNALDWVVNVVDRLPASLQATATQADAINLDRATVTGQAPMISTDPPYYDNIGYADLSDFFYIWLRKTVGPIYPENFRTLLVPKKEELVATPYRFAGGRREAERFFEEGLVRVFEQVREHQNPDYPFTVYYAFKQAEDESTDNGVATASTGWETMLEGLMKARFTITGTWPVRTERGNRMIGLGTNALASSIVLACRTRAENASAATRSEFLRELRRELPGKLKTLQQSSIAPVDLAQAAIGPGMAIFSKYSMVTEPNGARLPVRTALQLINQVLDEVLSAQDSEHDRESGWAVAWFEQFGMVEGAFGDGETLATARAVSVESLVRAGIVKSGRGKVSLIPRADLPTDWDPAKDSILTDWEIAQYLIRALEKDGRTGAATLKAKIGSRADMAKDLAYRLYTICERKGRAQEALAYNNLVVEWPEIMKAAADVDAGRVTQTRF